MSRGLGKVQRAVLVALQEYEHHFEMKALAARVFHPDLFPPPGLEDDDWMAYMDQRYKAIEATTRAQYVSAFRAVQELDRIGLVTTEIHYPKPIFGFMPPDTPRWKSVQLSVDKRNRLSTLKSPQRSRR